MKAVKIILAALVLIFIVIQFIPSGMPENNPDDERSIVNSSLVAEPVLSRLTTSCFDCHSNQVNFPWYAKLAPSSWFLSGHINEGREHLNFSEWEDYSRREKLSLLKEIGEEIEAGTMPLKSYLLIHRDAKLDEEDVSMILKWVEEGAETLMGTE